MIQCSIFTTIDNNKVARKGNSCSNHQSFSVNIITISINKAWIILHWAPRREWMTHFVNSLFPLLQKDDTDDDDDNNDTDNSNDVTRIFIPTNGKQRLASSFVWGKRTSFQSCPECTKFRHFLSYHPHIHISVPHHIHKINPLLANS